MPHAHRLVPRPVADCEAAVGEATSALAYDDRRDDSLDPLCNLAFAHQLLADAHKARALVGIMPGLTLELLDQRTREADQCVAAPEAKIMNSGMLSWLRAYVRGKTVLERWSAGAPGQRRVLLHAGLHKTGTSALQEFLSSAAGRLRARGVLYPESGRPANWPHAHHNIAWQLAGDRRFRSSNGTLDDLATEIAAFTGDAILSSEDFESVLGTPARLAVLFRHFLLKEHAFTIVLWVREQASYLESLFFELLKHRMAEEAERVCEAVLSQGQIRHEDWTFHFDYDRIWQNLRDLPAKVAVRPYAHLAGNSSIADCLTFAELVSVANAMELEQRANHRQNIVSALSLFCQNRLGSSSDRVARVLTRLLDRRMAHLSSYHRALLIARFAAGNQRLARTCGFSANALAIPLTHPQTAFPWKHCSRSEYRVRLRMIPAILQLIRYLESQPLWTPAAHCGAKSLSDGFIGPDSEPTGRLMYRSTGLYRLKRTRAASKGRGRVGGTVAHLAGVRGWFLVPWWPMDRVEFGSCFRIYPVIRSSTRFNAIGVVQVAARLVRTPS
jgi:hypothetical protein